MLFPIRQPWFTGTWTQALIETAKCQLALEHNSDAQQSLRNYLWVMDGADQGIAAVDEARVLLKNNRGK